MVSEIEKQQRLTEKLLYWLKGNHDAVRFCIDITFVAHVWDDLYDEDRKRSKEEINDAFRCALYDIPSNPFYVYYMNQLRPLMLNSILCWEDANILEQRSSSQHDKHLAFGLRASFIQIFNYCAYLIGGIQWAREIGPEIRRYYQEPLESFLQEMN